MQIKNLIMQLILQIRVISDKLTDLIDIHMCKPCLRSNTHTQAHTHCIIAFWKWYSQEEKIKTVPSIFSLSTCLNTLWCQQKIISIRNKKKCKEIITKEPHCTNHAEWLRPLARIFPIYHLIMKADHHEWI